MADIKVRQLDDHIVDVLKVRARNRGVSLEEELRTIITNSVKADRQTFRREIEAIAARIREACPVQATDSAQIIREERDAWG